MQLITQNIQSVDEQKHLNICRQYLKVITVSNITKPCVCRLDDQYMFQRVHESRYYWPRIERPPQNVWKMWRIAIRRILSKDLQTKELKKGYKMGKWLLPATKVHKRWRFIYSPSLTTVFARTPRGYIGRYAQQLSWNTIQTTTLGEYHFQEILDDCTPISYKKEYLYNNINSESIPIKNHISWTWNEYLHTLDMYEYEMVKNHTGHRVSDLIQIINDQQTILIYSDGEVTDTMSGGAWVIADSKDEILITGWNPNTGHLEYQTSYRTKVQACLVAFIFIVRLCQFYDIPTPKTIYYCDNEATVNKIKHNGNIKKNSSDRDILDTIHSILPPNTEAIYVYGHQEKKTDLTIPEYLNTIADYIATRNKTKPLQIHPPHKIAVYVNGYYIPDNIQYMIRKETFRVQAQKALCHKYLWSQDTFESIDWVTHGSTLRSGSYNKRKQRLKLVHNHLAFGKINFESKMVCPYCEINEKKVCGIAQDHFMCCARSNKYKRERINRLTEELGTIGTTPTLKKLLVENVIRFYNNDGTTPQSGIYATELKEQFIIGWRHFMRGRVTKKFYNIMRHEQEYIHPKAKRNHWKKIWSI